MRSVWQFSGRPCGWQPRTETMPAIFRSSPADFQTGIAFVYNVADSTSNSTQDVVWKMVGKAYWRILCGQVGTKLMNCHCAKSAHSFRVLLYCNSCRKNEFYLVQIFGYVVIYWKQQTLSSGSEFVADFFFPILSLSF